MQPTLEPVRQVHTHVATPLPHPHSHATMRASIYNVVLVVRRLTDFHPSAHVLQNAKRATWQYYTQQRTLQSLTVIDNYTYAFCKFTDMLCMCSYYVL